ncbi:MAG: hypothetical protein ACO25F_08425 [Erythrobacter sp.]
MTQSRDIESQQGETGLFLLFPRGGRPDRASIYRFVAAHPGISISLDPSLRPSLRLIGGIEAHSEGAASGAMAATKDCNWLELLRDGLTFDLAGLTLGEPLATPEVEYRFDSRDDLSLARFEALCLSPGAHLAGGEASLPVLRGMLRLARELVQHFEQIEAVAWSPAHSIIGRRFFESSTTAWLDGGAFPALGLTSFRETIDGGLQSVGLDFLIGQELRIEPSLASDKVAATRLGIRLINQLVLAGPVARAEQIIGPSGQPLQLEPSANGKFIRVWGN